MYKTCMMTNVQTQQSSAPLAAVCKACGAPLSFHNSRGSKNGYDLLACKTCGTVTVHPFPTEEELISFYQSYKGSTDYTAKKDRKIRRAAKRIRRLIPLTHGKRFLDVGCNYGYTVKAALDLGLDATGIDIDDTAVTASAKAFGPTRFRTLPVQAYAREGHQADIVYTSEVIEHVPDPDGFVSAIADILPQGGVLYLTTPDAGHFFLPADFTLWNDVMPPEHITYFTRKGLRLLLEKHGLKVKKFFFNLKPGIRLIAVKA